MDRAIQNEAADHPSARLPVEILGSLGQYWLVFEPDRLFLKLASDASHIRRLSSSAVLSAVSGYLKRLHVPASHHHLYTLTNSPKMDLSTIAKVVGLSSAGIFAGNYVQGLNAVPTSPLMAPQSRCAQLTWSFSANRLHLGHVEIRRRVVARIRQRRRRRRLAEMALPVCRRVEVLTAVLSYRPRKLRVPCIPR